MASQCFYQFGRYLLLKSLRLSPIIDRINEIRKLVGLIVGPNCAGELRFWEQNIPSVGHHQVLFVVLDHR